MDVRDEVCGMSFDSKGAAATLEFEGRRYYFCSERCRNKFREHPDWYVVTKDSAPSQGPGEPDSGAESGPTGTS
jgi:Cu+-exporting ATPase